MTNQVKLLKNLTYTLDCILFVANLGWQIETFSLKLSKIVKSFYRNIVW